MKKKLAIIIPVAVIIIAVLSAGVYANAKSLSLSKGICLVADNGSYLFIDEHGSPIQMSNRDRTEIFDGLKTGDEILVLHDGIQETYPGRTGAYYCIKTGEGKEKEIPQATVDSLRELGWLEKPTHEHELAEIPQVSEPEEPNVYCGNTVTTFILNGTEYSIMYGNSLAVTDMLRTMVFDPQKLCKCLPEFEIRTEFGDETYGVNLSQGYVRCNKGQAELTQEQIEIIDKARDEAVNQRMFLD